MHIRPNIVFVALMLLGLLEIKRPMEGARPPFLGPPHTFVLFTIDAEFLAAREPFIKTISVIYNYAIKKSEIVEKNDN
jgi:hypothetical protein